MSIKIDLFPALTKDIITGSGYKADHITFGYTEVNQFYKLQTESIDSIFRIEENYKLYDERCDWYPNTHNLRVNKRCGFGDVSVFFGVGGVVRKDATLGIALIWSSKETNLCGAISFGNFRNTSGDCNFVLDHTFESGSLEGVVSLKIVLFLQDIKEQQFGYAGEIGTVLGELENIQIHIDGNGSVFPIKEVQAPGQPLWWVDYNAIDPMVDAFKEENVCVILNSAHANYDMLRIDSSLKEARLLIEILSCALQIIVQSVKDSVGTEWSYLTSGQGFDSGSIAEVIYNFTSRFEWEIASPNALSMSIRKFFEMKL